MSLRACIMIVKNFLEVTDDGEFTGLFGPVWNSFFPSVRSTFPNMSISHETTYAGCLERLQKNESDVMATTTVFPIVQPGLRQGTVTQTFKTVMLSAYNNTVDQSSTSVMDAFDALTPSVWSLTAFTAALITVLVMVSFRVQEMTSSANFASRLNGILKKRRTKWQQCKWSVSVAIDVAMGNIFKQHTAYSDNSSSLSAKAVLFSFAIFT